MHKEILHGQGELAITMKDDIGILEVRQCIEFADLSDEEVQSIINTIKEFTTVVFLHYTKNINISIKEAK